MLNFKIQSLLGLVLAATTSQAFAEEVWWELGIGVAGLQAPFYPGAADDKGYVLPIPHLSYLSEDLKIDDGLDLTVFRQSRVRINLSGDFALPVNSRDSQARQGMNDLDPVIQVGPSLEVRLGGGRYQPYHFRAELPVRLAIATDLQDARGAGWVLEPRLTYETRRPFKTGFAWLLSAGLRYATADYHAYYYDVAPVFATPSRPGYSSSGGYSGLFIDAIANWRLDDIILFALLRYQGIDNTAFENSPLVEEKDYVLFAAGISWIFSSNK